MRENALFPSTVAMLQRCSGIVHFHFRLFGIILVSGLTANACDLETSSEGIAKTGQEKISVLLSITHATWK